MDSVYSAVLAAAIVVARHTLPQFSGVPVKGSPADKLPRTDGRVDISDLFVKVLRLKGIKVEKFLADTDQFSPYQTELNREKVNKIVQSAKDSGWVQKPIFVASDNFILDGHHRWAALERLGREVLVYRIDLPIKELVPVANDFTVRMGIPQERS